MKSCFSYFFLSHWFTSKVSGDFITATVNLPPSDDQHSVKFQMLKESQMALPYLFYLFIYLFVSLFIYLFIYLVVYPFFIYLFNYLSQNAKI